MLWCVSMKSNTEEGKFELKTYVFGTTSRTLSVSEGRRNATKVLALTRECILIQRNEEVEIKRIQWCSIEAF